MTGVGSDGAGTECEAVAGVIIAAVAWFVRRLGARTYQHFR